ncbi:hypothetical protein FNV43_RR22467 [Rhamnella rubrinervis]|uniref:Alpha/beta hydrolase fold-3 domain-containing protein n=1 Tax=Rhamnella rubrinervis TaxID=2594499 RepID=A0A8K0DW89_9ROSA|nr:hypothetical protein FNV43_RR22467 [Rhamnella rubrinervis]
MDNTTTTDEVAIDFLPLFRIYKDGRIHRFTGTDVHPPSTNPDTGVQSKDVVVSSETGLSGRLFLPRITDSTAGKLPFLLFIHGGAFVIESAFSPAYHNHVAALAAEANVVAFSVDYRRAPEHHLPIAYDDTWDALQWAISHSGGDGPEEWLNRHADFRRVYVAGDSAGANIAHNVVVRAGVDGLINGANITGMVLFHPYFDHGEVNKLLDIVFPKRSRPMDPRVNPGSDPNQLAKLACEKVLIFVAQKDFLRDRGLSYYEALKTSGWGGSVELADTEDEGHVFHLHNPGCDRALALMEDGFLFKHD